MPATPARIAISLNDGVVLSKIDASIKANHPNADDGGENEIEMFFDNAADAQVLLDERWNWKSAAGRAQEQIELDSSFGLGTTVPVTPAVPIFTLTDETRGIVQVPCRARAYSIDYVTDRYAIEVIGVDASVLSGFSSSDLLLLEDNSGILLIEDDTDGTSGMSLG